jgi:hypothetical protein
MTAVCKVFIILIVLLIRCLCFNITLTANITLRERLTTAKVMLCAIVKQEQLYIEEWLDYHRALGYDYAELYDNEDHPSQFMAGLHKKYGDFVNVTHFPGDGKQRQAYKLCVKRNNNKNMWSSFIDVDEFVVLRNHSNIKEFLRNVAPDGGSVVLNWSVFGCNGTVQRTSKPVLVRFVQSSSKTSPQIKTTAYLPHVFDPIIHHIILHPGFPTVTQHGVLVSSNTSRVYSNDRKVANINHYVTKTLEEFRLKRLRGRAALSKSNALYRSGSPEAIEKEIEEFFRLYSTHEHYPIKDTVARDFYLKNVVGFLGNTVD